VLLALLVAGNLAALLPRRGGNDTHHGDYP
jgi:hypothetical protein